METIEEIFIKNSILIIGIDSFTGKHLAQYLKENSFVVYGTSVESKENNIFKCDITKKQEIHNVLNNIKPEYIINLAAISFVATQNRELFYSVNVLAVENLLQSVVEIQDYQPKKIILASSATIYGNQNCEILDESLVSSPVNHYGISKLAMELIAKTYFDKLNIIITRPFNYTGPGQADHFVIPKIVSHYRKHKREIELGNIDVFREFNDISFVCEIYKRLLLSEIKSEIFNIASNRTIALKEVIGLMNKIADYEIDTKVNPLFVRPNEIVRLSGSPKKLFEAIGTVEQKSFEKTLEDMFKG